MSSPSVTPKASVRLRSLALAATSRYHGFVAHGFVAHCFSQFSLTKTSRTSETVPVLVWGQCLPAPPRGLTVTRDSSHDSFQVALAIIANSGLYGLVLLYIVVM